MEILRADLIITLVKINRSACRHRDTQHSSRPFLRIHHSAICYQLHLSAGRRRRVFNGIPGNKIRRYRYDVEVEDRFCLHLLFTDKARASLSPIA